MHLNGNHDLHHDCHDDVPYLIAARGALARYRQHACLRAQRGRVSARVLMSAQYWEREPASIRALEWICVSVFTVEYLIRLATAPHKFRWAIRAWHSTSELELTR